MSSKVKSKIVFFVSHTSLSIVFFASWLFFAKNSFFPEPWFTAEGVWGMLKLILVIDVVAGPLLAAMVYDKSKKEWKRDLAIILLIQLSFFAYGAKTLWDARPSHVVWMTGNLYIVSDEQVKKSGGDFDLSLRPMHHVLQIASAKELALMQKKAEGIDVPFYALSELWRPLDGSKPQSGWDATQLGFVDEQDNKAWSAFKSAHPDWSEYLYVGVYGRETTALWAWSRKIKYPIDIIWVKLPK